MKEQTDFKEPIKSKGCYFLTMLAIAGKVAFQKIPDEEVYEILDLAQKTKSWTRKTIADGCYLYDPAGVANLFFKKHKIKKRLLQVGVEENGKSHFWQGDSYDYAVYDYATAWGKHFVTEWYNPDPRIKLGKLNKIVFYKVKNLGE